MLFGFCLFVFPEYFACLPSHLPAAANPDTFHSWVGRGGMLVNDTEVWGVFTAFSVFEVVHSKAAPAKYIFSSSKIHLPLAPDSTLFA